MFTNSAHFDKLSSTFQMFQSKDNNQIKQGEQQLKQLQQDPQYVILLFNFINSQNLNSDIQLRAAIEFKQWFQKYSQLDDYQAQYLSEVITTIKNSIFESFVTISTQNKAVTYKIEEAIVFLAEREFHHNWDNLTQKINEQLAQTFNSQQNIDLSIIILKLLKKITKKYEFQMRSDKLYLEIIHVCDTMHNHLFQLTQKTIEMIHSAVQQQGSDPQGIISLVKLLKNLMIIFYHLNFQDLHPDFQDNLHNWMQQISLVLKLQIQPQQLNNNDIILFKCKGEALRGILLYATNYRDEFMGLIKEFSAEIWSMCTITGTDQKFDKIVLNSLRYFKNLILCSEFKDFFEQNMDKLLTSLIIPNLGLSVQDKETFNEEPESFIQNFFEQSDVHSRRSTTVELLKNLCRKYTTNMQTFITNVIPQYVQKLNQNGPNPSEEIVLINLVIDGSTVAYRPKDGVSDVSLGSELITYFYNNVIKVNLASFASHVLQNDALIESKFEPSFVAFYLRFFFYFRHFIPKEEILEITKIVSYFCKTKNECLRDLSLFTVEQLLNLKDGDIKNYMNLRPYFNKDNVEPQIQSILQNVYLCMKDDDINNYSLRAVIVILQILKENCSKYVEALSDLYKQQLLKIKDGYDFQKAVHIFDGIGLLIQYTSNAKNDKVSVIEGMISNELNVILQNQAQMSDLFPFVIQVFGLFVHTNFGKSNQQNYMVIFDSLMQTNNWVDDNQSQFQAYVSYINSYVSADSQQLFKNIDNFKSILTSVCNMKYDQIFFQLADIICDRLTLEQLRNSGILRFILDNSMSFYQNVVQTQNPTDKTPRRTSKPLFIKEFINFICKLIIKHTACEIIKDFDQINQGLLANIFNQEITLIKLVSQKNDRKLLFLTLSDLLLQNLQSLNQEVWGKLINGIIENCGNRQNSFRGVNQIQFTKQTTTNSASDSGFQKLQALKLIEMNSMNAQLQSIENEDVYFGQKFKQFYSNPQIQQAINFQQVLTPQNQQVLSKLMQDKQ